MTRHKRRSPAEPTACDLLISELIRSCDMTQGQAVQLRRVFMRRSGERVYIDHTEERRRGLALAMSLLQQGMPRSEISAAIMVKVHRYLRVPITSGVLIAGGAAGSTAAVPCRTTMSPPFQSISGS